MQADLDTLAMLRGSALVECDAKRELAVNTHDAEHKLIDQQQADRMKRARPWWRLW